MSKRVIHVVEPFAGGIVTFLSSLVESLPEATHIFIHGERASVMPFAEVRKRFRNTNVRFIRWNSAQRSLRPSKDMAALAELYIIMKRLKAAGPIDAVHLHSSKSGFLGRIACRLLNLPNVIYTPNGAPFLDAQRPFSNYLYRKLEKLASRLGGKVVCCSPSEREAYRHAGIPAIYVNNGLVRETVPPAVPDIQPSGFNVVTTGRIIDQKDPQLFNSIASYFEDVPIIRFIWIGDGPDRGLLTASNITITGWKSREETQAIMSRARLYLSTARFEGLPFAVLEALTLKKPVLLTDCVGNRDLVRERLNGDLFRTREEAIIKIMEYFNNSKMLSVMGRHSQVLFNASHDAVNSYSGYRNLYQNLSKTKASRYDA